MLNEVQCNTTATSYYVQTITIITIYYTWLVQNEEIVTVNSCIVVDIQVHIFLAMPCHAADDDYDDAYIS